MEFRDHTVFHTLASAANNQYPQASAKRASSRIGLGNGIAANLLSRCAPSLRPAKETAHG
jgi:hypothetical protein